MNPIAPANVHVDGTGMRPPWGRDTAPPSLIPLPAQG